MQYVEAYQQAGESSDTLMEEVKPLPGNPCAGNLS